MRHSKGEWTRGDEHWRHRYGFQGQLLHDDGAHVSAMNRSDKTTPKRLRFHWSMSSAGVPNKGTFARSACSGVPDIAAHLEYCRRAEACGIESLLTAVGFHRPDPMVLATALGVQTKSIEFMLALRSGIASPTLVVQQINTLSSILGGRLSLNIVAGHTPGEQRGYGDFLDHDQRYARTAEFLKICRRLWNSKDPVTFEGRYYRVDGAVLNTPWCGSDSRLRGDRGPDRRSDRSSGGGGPEIYVGGKSPAAIELAIAHADCLWTMPEPPATLRERMQPLLAAKVGLGLLASIIARPTREEALAAADQVLAVAGDAPRRTHAKFAEQSDSQVFRSTLASAEGSSEWLTNTLWTGAVPYFGAPSIAFVGSYDEIVSTLFEYRDVAGVSQYLFLGWPDLDEMLRFHREIIPRVRKLEVEAQSCN